MATYKNIRVKKRGGGTRLQRVKVLASGKYKFVKNLTRSKSRTVTRRKTSKKRRRTYTARRRKTRRRRTTTIPIAIVGGLVAAFSDEAALVMQGDFAGAASSLGNTFSSVQNAWSNLGPLFIGCIIHFIASKLGVNRYLGQARVPFIRI